MGRLVGQQRHHSRLLFGEATTFMHMKPAWFVRGDVDGFFGLFVDNLLQLMLINVLCREVCGLPAELVNTRIIPGAAISILLGNLFYTWQARRIMEATGRDDVTALPYGINTVSLIAYVFLVMAPIYGDTGDANLAWQAGLFACLVGGVLEIIGAFVADWLRRNTPRAALLTALAGIAITYIAMGFIFRMFAMPGVAILPMFIILIAYAARVRMLCGLPGGLIAVVVGVALAWILKAFDATSFSPPTDALTVGFYPPVPVFSDVFALLTSESGWSYFAVIFPMALFNIVGSLQNLESAEAAGDRYETRPSLLVNGIGTVVAALLGSPFPTTIYIGHPAWKAMGARAGYSAVNGIVVALLSVVGGVTLVLRVVPIEATLAILLWIGITMTAQAFAAVPRRHALAVAFGLIPALAAWARYLVETTGQAAGKSLPQLIATLTSMDVYITGILTLSQGFLITAMVFGAALAFMIDRNFLKAAGWTAAAAVLSFLGIIHAYTVTEDGVVNEFGPGSAWELSLIYLLASLILVAMHHTRKREEGAEET